MRSVERGEKLKEVTVRKKNVTETFAAQEVFNIRLVRIRILFSPYSRRFICAEGDGPFMVGGRDAVLCH